VWLTALDLAADEDLILVTSNTNDFADPADESRLAPELRADLIERALPQDRIGIVSTALEFAARYVDPVRRDTAHVRSELADKWLKLDQEIIDGVPWFSSLLDETQWDLGIELEEVPTLAGFDPTKIALRAVEQP
jgi:hypothetical protein